jgi:hypothetical protein
VEGVVWEQGKLLPNVTVDNLYRVSYSKWFWLQAID